MQKRTVLFKEMIAFTAERSFATVAKNVLTLIEGLNLSDEEFARVRKGVLDTVNDNMRNLIKFVEKVDTLPH